MDALLKRHFEESGVPCIVERVITPLLTKGVKINGDVCTNLSLAKLELKSSLKLPELIGMTLRPP